MEVIRIKVRDSKKAAVLREFLKTLDYVESVSIESADKKRQIPNEAAFFALAGLWARRNVTQENLRDKTWNKDP